MGRVFPLVGASVLGVLTVDEKVASVHLCVRKQVLADAVTGTNGLPDLNPSGDLFEHSGIGTWTPMSQVDNQYCDSFMKSLGLCLGSLGEVNLSPPGGELDQILGKDAG